MSERITMTNQLSQAVKDAHLLLTHAAHTGLQLDDAMLATLVQAQYRKDGEEWTIEDEAAFWQAFSHLNVLVKPVTLESLKAVALPERPSRWFDFLRFFNKAYRAAGVYTVLSILFMALLLLTQMYWLMGAKLAQHLRLVTGRIQQLRQLDGFVEGRFTEEYDDARMEFETTRETMLLWSQPWSVLLATIDAEFSQPYDQQAEFDLDITDIRDQLKDAANRLTAFKDFQFDEAGQELNAVYRAKVDELTETLIRQQTAAEQAVNNDLFLETTLRAQYVLHVLQQYVLPVLYGLLGAIAYVLRSLIASIQAETYTGRANSRYRMSLFSGALTGLLIGFFIIPTETSGLATLPPMALSFLAGYNVEVLFIAMDKFIVAVIGGIQRRTKGSPEQNHGKQS